MGTLEYIDASETFGDDAALEVLSMCTMHGDGLVCSDGEFVPVGDFIEGMTTSVPKATKEAGESGEAF